MEEEVMMAPAGLNPADRDTFHDRQLLVRKKRNKQELAIDAYTSWESRYKRLKSDYDQLTSTDGTPRTKTEPGTPRGQGQGCSRSSSRSGSGSWSPSPRERPKPAPDTKPLKPAMLETSMPPLALSEWFKCFEIYREASGWGQANYITQLAYLCMCQGHGQVQAVMHDLRDAPGGQV